MLSSYCEEKRPHLYISKKERKRWKQIHMNMIEQFHGYHSRIKLLQAEILQHAPASSPRSFRIRGRHKKVESKSPDSQSACRRRGLWAWSALLRNGLSLHLL